MLEKPAIPDSDILACLSDAYGLRAAQLVFLPLGADRDTAVYRAVAAEGTSYFVKLRRGVFDEVAVAWPRFLSDQGIEAVIPPLATTAGQLSADLAPYRLILYPFVAGRDGYEVMLSDQHWRDLGAALRRIHTAAIPLALLGRIPRETYSPRWREIVRTFLQRIEVDVYAESVAARMAAFLRANRAEVADLVDRAERLALVLQARSPTEVVCHADLHAGNVLIDGSDHLYIVDWDTLTLAPIERDLMYAGGGQFCNHRTPAEEEALFYQGYGPTPLNAIALAYYRYERIVEDIAVYCEQLLLSEEGGDDRERSLGYLMSNFLPGGTLEITQGADRALGE